MARPEATIIVRRMSRRTLVRHVLAYVVLLACLLLFAAPAPADRQAAAFNFVVTIKDDGEGKAGGWQEATARLAFTRLKPGDKDSCSPGDKYEVWRCPMKVGIPVRTHKDTFSTSRAAAMAADAATVADENVKRATGETEAAFCKRFRTKMEAELNTKTLGARVTQS